MNRFGFNVVDSVEVELPKRVASKPKSKSRKVKKVILLAKLDYKGNKMYAITTDDQILPISEADHNIIGRRSFYSVNSSNEIIKHILIDPISEFNNFDNKFKFKRGIIIEGFVSNSEFKIIRSNVTKTFKTGVVPSE